jgi:hypothetical protein
MSEREKEELGERRKEDNKKCREVKDAIRLVEEGKLKVEEMEKVIEMKEKKKEEEKEKEKEEEEREGEITPPWDRWDELRKGREEEERRRVEEREVKEREEEKEEREEEEKERAEK